MAWPGPAPPSLPSPLFKVAVLPLNPPLFPHSRSSSELPKKKPSKTCDLPKSTGGLDTGGVRRRAAAGAYVLCVSNHHGSSVWQPPEYIFLVSESRLDRGLNVGVCVKREKMTVRSKGWNEMV